MTQEGSQLYITDLAFDYTSGIALPTTSPQAAGVRYNLNGQQVNQGYKGIVVEKGRKMLTK